VKLANPDYIAGSAGNAVDGFCDPKAPFGKQDPKRNVGWLAHRFDADSGLNAGVPLFRAASRCCDAHCGGLVFTGDLLGDVLAFDAASEKSCGAIMSVIHGRRRVSLRRSDINV